ncbi:hypothetical protein BN903_51 [Halorubrum sp. AJ67]|nr:hypothetical protein BN903_51 [Halorubrum sp. AJ67]
MALLKSSAVDSFTPQSFSTGDSYHLSNCVSVYYNITILRSQN